MKWTALFLAFAVMISCLTLTTLAAEELGFTVKVGPSVAATGSQVTVMVSLTNYTENVDAIRGLQVDITGVDPAVLSVVSYETMIEDPSAFSNTASYSEKNQRVRLVYMHLSDTLPAPHEDVLKVVFQVNADLAGEGSIVLPVTVKIQTTAAQLTLNSTCTISYSEDAVQTQTIDIAWGELAYTYTDGVWNTQTHRYEGGGWSDNGTGSITVTNTGDARVTVEFLYTTDRTDVSGSFADENGVAVECVELISGESETVKLILMGNPEEALDNTIVGSATIRIGGE